MVVLIPLSSATLLGFAAFMKWQQLPIVNRVDGGFLHDPIVNVALIMFEAALAVALICATFPGRLTYLPAFCFAGFAVGSFYFGITGAASCGCFGQFHINPWITCGVDAAFASALVVWRPRQGILPMPRWTQGVAFLAILCIVLAASIPRLPRRSPLIGLDIASSEVDGLIQAGNLTILDPSLWIGKPLPIAKQIDLGEGLLRENWIVVLHQVSCHTCQEALPRYAAQATDETEGHIALIEMPPYEQADESGRKSDTQHSRAVLGKLSADRKWFASTPVVLLLQDGIVRDTAEGKAATALKADWQRFRLVAAN